MAVFETTLYAAQDPLRANISRLAAPNLAGGDIEFATITYSMVDTEAATDTINLALLPAGCIPVPALSSVVCANPGTALVIDIGTAADVDGWADGAILSSGGEVKCNSAANAAWNAPTPLVADDATDDNAMVYATVMTATSLSGTVDLIFTLAYKRGR